MQHCADAGEDAGGVLRVCERRADRRARPADAPHRPAQGQAAGLAGCIVCSQFKLSCKI